MIITILVVLGVLLSSVFGDYADGAWRKSLDGKNACWTDRNCQRVMTCAHGGEWNVTFPYDSFPAFQQAYIDGADAIKGDFRVAKDNIGVVMHSSPVEFYESVNCRGKFVEDMTSEECTQCQMEITQYHFITVPYLLAWAENKVNVMFCVKESSDIPRAITTLIENNAAHRAFLEVDSSKVIQLEVDQVPHWDEVYYVAHIHNKNELSSMLNASESVKKRAFLLEFEDWDTWEDVETDIQTAEKYGFRTFAKTRDGARKATVTNHLDLYNRGFDVAYTYNLTNAVTTRKMVNTANKIVPP